jgi:3-oxoacyl-[acyl-carrier protein] reductase
MTTNTVRFDFTGAAVLVTGGTSGLGHAVATAFADAGARVTVTGTKASPGGYETDLGRFAYHQAEMTDSASVDALVAALDSLDILVNNAGANFPGGRDEWEPDAFAAALSLNLAGPMRLTVGCRPLLEASGLEGGGCVVNTVSMAAFRAVPIVPGYASAKAGVAALTWNLAKLWSGRGIRVNAVAPGLIETPMTAPMKAFPELLDPELAKIPLGRMGTPADVVGAVQFLASSAAAYMTGTILGVDGGYLLS